MIAEATSAQTANATKVVVDVIADPVETPVDPIKP
jgi:hypothetical protein